VEQLKLAAARAAVALVEDGMAVGLGSGSTASLAVGLIGRRVAEGLRIAAVPTSEETARQARALSIPLVTLEECGSLDLTIDGADEVEPARLGLIKGRGGALLREKIVAAVTRRLVIVIDESKLVDRLGTHDPVPVEVVPFGWKTTAARLAGSGARPTLRAGARSQPFITDGGHYILDCAFGPIESPAELARQLDATIGVIEHGLFLEAASEVIVAGANGVRTLRRAPEGS
jgi:ribose 5-phosphate isomerase A